MTAKAPTDRNELRSRLDECNQFFVAAETASESAIHLARWTHEIYALERETRNALYFLAAKELGIATAEGDGGFVGQHAVENAVNAALGIEWREFRDVAPLDENAI